MKELRELSFAYWQEEGIFKMFYFNEDKFKDTIRYTYEEGVEDEIYFEEESDKIFENQMGDDVKYLKEEIAKLGLENWKEEYTNVFNGPYPMWELNVDLGGELHSSKGEGTYPKGFETLLQILSSFEIETPGKKPKFV